ncbi:MAG: hypothetical protein RTU92_10560, partial [Candidatus Thorarchaeota archaeon]
EDIKIWKTSDQSECEIIAVSHRGSASNYHIEVHPKYKYREQELFLEIERYERARTNKQKSKMYMYTVEPDSKRINILSEMGYEDYGLHEYNHVFPSNESIPPVTLPAGFTIRNLQGEQDYSDFIKVVGSLYSHCGENMTVEKLKFMSEAEFYHQDLNLIAVTEERRFAAFCTYRLDPLTNIAEMELIGSHPEFSNMGLESALLSEGLNRLTKYQPILICAVEVDKSDPLNQVLESVGFIQSVKMNQWGKTIE